MHARAVFLRAGFGCLVLAILAWVPPVAAHAAGVGLPTDAQPVPMPAWVTWVIGAAVVGFSFAMVLAFGASGAAPGPVSAVAAVGSESHTVPRRGRVFRRGAWWVGVAILVIHASVPRVQGEFPVLLVWVLVWSAAPVVSYLFGYAWGGGPFAPLVPLAEATRRRLRLTRTLAASRGTWIAVAVLLLFTWLEVWEGSRASVLVARVGVAYVGATFLAMVAFGSEAWLLQAEPVTRSLRWWAACAPWSWSGGRPYWRGASGLSRLPALGWGGVAFALAMLLGVNFDAFLGTPLGSRVAATMPGPEGTGSAALLVFGFAVFFGAFALCAAWIARAAGSLRGFGSIAATFVASVLPIAAGYHVAHNLFYVYDAWPLLWRAAADPLALGYISAPPARLPLMAAEWATQLQMLLIVVAHVLAVLVAHRLAFHTFPGRAQAIRGEVPLTLVMVAYTFVGLWLVGGGYHDVVG